MLSLFANHIKYTGFNRVLTETLYISMNCTAAVINTIAFVLVCVAFVKYLKENIKERKDSLTETDIKRMIITGSKEGVVEEKEKEYILNIFNFNDKGCSKVIRL